MDYLRDNRGDPDVRSVLEDLERSSYRASTTSRLGVALNITVTATAGDVDVDADVDVVAADADVDADVAGDVDADADADVDAVAVDVDVDADVAADVDVDDVDDVDDVAADVDVAADADALTKLLTEEPDMRDGLKIVQLPGRYGHSVTRVGWLRRVSGDEWELVNGASILRSGGSRTIGELADDGPGDDHRLAPVDKIPEEIHRLLVRRTRPANPEKWIGYCPKPTDW